VRKKVLIGGLGITLAAFGAAILLAPDQAADAPTPVQHPPQLAHTAENPLFAGLPARRAIAPSKGELFSSPPPPKPPAPVIAAPTPPAPPTPPAMPYRVAGLVVHDGRAEVVLSKGDRVITVRPGETLEGGYRVGNIDADGVTLVYMPLGIAQHLPATFPFSRQPQVASDSRNSAAEREAPAADGPPQLRWQGPERVRAGSQFQVVLKLSSSQPVRFSPVELSYDAKLLEPLAVRAGDYFSDGKLGYRVTRGGSIFVGASKTNLPAADVDFLIVTFKAIRTGEPAELKISSIELTDLEGEVVAHQPPPAFRTSIQQ
jgi:hypothetical protein